MTTFLKYKNLHTLRIVKIGILKKSLFFIFGIKNTILLHLKFIIIIFFIS